MVYDVLTIGQYLGLTVLGAMSAWGTWRAAHSSARAVENTKNISNGFAAHTMEAIAAVERIEAMVASRTEKFDTIERRLAVIEYRLDTRKGVRNVPDNFQVEES